MMYSRHGLKNLPELSATGGAERLLGALRPAIREAAQKELARLSPDTISRLGGREAVLALLEQDVRSQVLSDLSLAAHPTVVTPAPAQAVPVEATEDDDAGGHPAIAPASALDRAFMNREDGKILVTMAFMMETGMLFITGRLMAEILIRNGLMTSHKEADRRASAGLRKLRGVSPEMMEEMPKFEGWPGHGASPIPFRLTPAGRQWALRQAGLERAREMVRLALADPEFERLRSDVLESAIATFSYQ